MDVVGAYQEFFLKYLIITPANINQPNIKQSPPNGVIGPKIRGPSEMSTYILPENISIQRVKRMPTFLSAFAPLSLSCKETMPTRIKARPW